MIRVLHYGMSSNLGGIEMFIMNVYRNIDRNKIQFDFLKFTDTIPFEKEILELGGRIYQVTPRSKSMSKCKKDIQDILDKKEHTILHAHINTCSFIQPILLAKQNGLKVIVHSHNEWKGNNFKTNLLHKLNKSKCNKILDKALACSDVAGKYMFNINYDICKNGIDLDKYKYDENVRTSTRESLGIDKDTFLIGHVGRFELQKNHKFLVEIIKELDKKIDNYKVCLVGEGSLKNEIENLVKEYNLEDKFLFLGIRNDINQLMMGFDLFLLPSLFEGLPFVLVEAQATGLKSFISDNISNESDIRLNLIESLSLDEVAIWNNNIIKYLNQFNQNSNRFSNIDEIKNNGYSIKETSIFLENIYID